MSAWPRDQKVGEIVSPIRAKPVLQRKKNVYGTAVAAEEEAQKKAFFFLFCFFSHVECSTKYPIQRKQTNIILVYILPSGNSVVKFFSVFAILNESRFESNILVFIR